MPAKEDFATQKYPKLAIRTSTKTAQAIRKYQADLAIEEGSETSLSKLSHKLIVKGLRELGHL